MAPHLRPRPFAIVDGTAWVPTGGQTGATPGGTYRDRTGAEYYMKRSISEGHARSEVLAAELYRLAGVRVPVMTLVSHSTGIGTASALVPGARGSKRALLTSAQFRARLHRGFAVDAWLSNWDVISTDGENVVIDQDGQPVRVDFGGALLFRARGFPKGTAFGTEVGEWDSLRNPLRNPCGAVVFGRIERTRLRASAQLVLDVPPAAIAAAVAEARFSQGVTERLTATLLARREDIRARQANLAASCPARTSTSW